MSTYPTSAELADMRRSIPTPRPWDDDVDHPWEGPTFTYERSLGIGYRTTEATCGCAECRTDSGLDSLARREASALRSRAYARMLREQDGTYRRPWLPISYIPPVLPMAWPEELGYGAPYTYRARRDDYVPDGGYRSTDTWSEDEPRSPLPIRYQPSLVITR